MIPWYELIASHTLSYTESQTIDCDDAIKLERAMRIYSMRG
jgi:hypothetical protein